MLDQENKLETIVLPRYQRSEIQSGIENIMMPWAYQPHPLQARYLAHLIWQFDGEYELEQVNSQLVEVMGLLMKQCSQTDYEPHRITIRNLHLTLSNIFSLFQEMQNYPVMYRTVQQA